MATSKITLYRTEITPDRNAWVENIHEYLVKHAFKTYEADNFQFQKIAINKEIVIAADQSKVGDQSLGNYLELVQENRSYFYFITNVSWTSSKAVKLVISMDTINTFGEDLEFDDKTSIIREHEDRLKLGFNQNTNVGYKKLIRTIDRQPENLQLPKDLKKSYDFTQTGLDFNWFLIYKTREGLTADNPGNPVECDLVADKSLLLKKGISNRPEVTMSNADIESNKLYYIDATNNPGGSWHYKNYPDRIQTISEGNILVFWKKDDNDALGRVMQYRKVGNSWSLKDEGVNFTLSLPITFINMRSLGTSEGTAPAAIINGYNDVINLKFRKQIDAGTISDVSTKAFDKIDKTDSKLMKIIRLPYAPVKITKNDNGEYVFPEDWEFNDGMMKLNTINLSKEFSNKIGDIDLDSYLKLETTVTPKDTRDASRESKLYNSDVYTIKAVYDSFAKEFKLEDSDVNGLGYNKELLIPVTFKPTNTVNSKFIFKFDKNPLSTAGYSFKNHEDFENYLVVDRNNEETIFSNDFINYIRNGINYDKKARHISAVTSAWGLGLGIGQTVATVGAQRRAATKEFDATYGRYAVDLSGGEMRKSFLSNATSPFLSAAAISAGFSAANAAISGIASYKSATDAIERKKQELSQQATSVSGADDVDLLQYYTGNRLQLKEYDTEPIAKNKVFNLFYYAGYAHDVQGIPNLDSRYWFNYVQCSPIFKHENTSVYTDYLDDIKVRFENGVTKFHYHPELEEGWDIDQQYENWEKTILDTSYFPDTPYPDNGVQSARLDYGSLGPILRVTYKSEDEINNIDTKLEVKYTNLKGQEQIISSDAPNQPDFNTTNIIKGSTKIYARKVNVWNDKYSSDWSVIVEVI